MSLDSEISLPFPPQASCIEMESEERWGLHHGSYGEDVRSTLGETFSYVAALGGGSPTCLK